MQRQSSLRSSNHPLTRSEPLTTSAWALVVGCWCWCGGTTRLDIYIDTKRMRKLHFHAFHAPRMGLPNVIYYRASDGGEGSPEPLRVIRKGSP